MRILIDGQTFETPEIHRGIGVYTKNVINQMVKQNYENEWFIAVSDNRNISELDSWVCSRLHVIVKQEFAPGSDYDRNKPFTDAIQQIIDQYHIDALWFPNGLMVNVLFLDRPVTCPTFVTIHDIIPYIFPIKDWARIITEEYHRRLNMIKNHDQFRLVMVSRATQADWEKYISKNSICAVTPEAANSKVFYCQREKKTNEEPYILFTGGFDYRKNIDGAIESFSLARKRHEADHDFLKYKLVIVGKYDEATKEKYENFISSKGIKDQVVLTGYVSDEELASLYHHADIFFFPSLYEGFGLPILEAMLSGDYIVAADNSSLPEVCGNHAVLFNAEKTGKMAEALYQGYLNHNKETEADIHARQQYALGFSWDKTAQGTLDMMEKYATPLQQAEKRPTLALFTPWPNQKTGIANYEIKLAPYLAQYFNITVFTPAEGKLRQKLNGIEVKGIHAFFQRQKKYDYKLFQIGNNTAFHKEIFDILEKEGGIAEVHDFILTPFFYGSYGKQGDRFEALLKAGYGEEKGAEFMELTKRIHNHPDIFDCPMAETVVAKASKTIFHNHWSKDQIEKKTVFTIPLASFAMKVPTQDVWERSLKKLKKLIAKNDQDILVSCFGWVNQNKRPKVTIQAISRLIEKGYSVKMVFWGENSADGLTEYIREHKLEDKVFISGYLPPEDYFTALKISDVVVNLRFPSMGEASATLCEAFQMGKPTIVSDLNQYQEYPDDVCWKLPICDQEEELLSEYIAYLIDHPEVRLALGKNAKAYAEYALRPERIAALYYRCITEQ